MQIGRKDVFWNYAATFMRIASGILVLPLVLRMLPTEEVALWSIFLTINSLTVLLDFGFSSSFSRNIAYVFSGVNELQAKGFKKVENKNSKINYGLLKSVIKAMQHYYGLMAIIFLLVFIIASPVYMSSVLTQYHGDKTEIWIAWFAYGVILAYELYTCYYTSLLSGRGLVKQNMQIIIVSQTVRIVISIILLLSGLGIISLVIGILISDLVNRTLSYRKFYDSKIKNEIKLAIAQPTKEILKVLAPNSFKIGLTTLGTFFLSQAITLISPFFLTLPEVAQYGISKQMTGLISSIGTTWFSTFYPQLTQYRVRGEIENVKRLYVKGKVSLILIFIILGTGLVLLGNPILELIHSKTLLLNVYYLIPILIFTYFDSNQSLSTATLLASNDVPFFKSVLASGILSLILLFMLFKFTNLGIFSMILAPAIILSAYQNWKWPLTVFKELHMKASDYYYITKTVWLELTQQKV